MLISNSLSADTNSIYVSYPSSGTLFSVQNQVPIKYICAQPTIKTVSVFITASNVGLNANSGSFFKIDNAAPFATRTVSLRGAAELANDPLVEAFIPSAVVTNQDDWNTVSACSHGPSVVYWFIYLTH